MYHLTSIFVILLFTLLASNHPPLRASKVTYSTCIQDHESSLRTLGRRLILFTVVETKITTD